MRIVSTFPAATEIVAALGASDRLVGISHACDYPPAIASLPRVTQSRVGNTASAARIDREVRETLESGGALFTLDQALIASLRPDLIVTQGICEVCAVSEADVCRIAADLTPVPSVVTLTASSLEGIFDDIARVGRALDATGEAEELLAGLRARMHSLHGRLRAARPPRRRVAVIEWLDPPYAAGHWVPDMVHRAGGVDVLAAAGEKSRRVAVETLRHAAPEVLIIAPCGYPLAAAVTEARREIARLRPEGTADREVWAVDGNAIVSRPGPRVVTGIEQIGRIMHGAILGQPAGNYSARVA